MSNTTRRDFLTGCGKAAAVVAACAQGCEAGEPPDIARGETADSEAVVRDLFADRRHRGQHLRRERCTYPDGRETLEIVVDATHAGTFTCDFAAGAPLQVSRVGDAWRLYAEWSTRFSPWVGRVLRVRPETGFEVLVVASGEWVRVGEA